MTLSESYYQTILTYWELISNSIHNFTDLLPDKSKYFLRVWMDTWTDKNFSNGKFLTRREKTKHTHIKQILLPSTILEFANLHDWSLMALWKKMAWPPLPKRILVPAIQKVPKKCQIFPAPSYKIRKNN